MSSDKWAGAFSLLPQYSPIGMQYRMIMFCDGKALNVTSLYKYPDVFTKWKSARVYTILMVDRDLKYVLILISVLCLL